MARGSGEKSTIVRSKGARKQRIVRAAFGVLERHAPRLGALWAERIWCTVPTTAKARLVLTKPGTVTTLPLDGGAASPTFVAETWGETGPIIYLMHGWGGYRGQLGAFVGPLTAAGYRVVALDAPSHGDARPGAFGAGRSLIPEFTATLNAAVRAFGPAYGIVAHSLGAGATTLAVLDGLAVERIVLISPMPDPNAFARGFADLLGFGDRVREGLIRRLERRVGRPLADFDAVSRARAAAEARANSGTDDGGDGTAGAPPMLVVHDHEDKQIPYAMGRAIAAAWQGAELCSTRGLGHLRILRDPDVISTVMQFLGARGGASRAGRADEADSAAVAAA